MTTMKNQICLLLALTATSLSPACAFRPSSSGLLTTAKTRLSSSTTHLQLSAIPIADPSSTLTTASSALATLDTFWQTSPYTAAAIACGVKASAADLVAQTQTNTEDTTDEDTSTTTNDNDHDSINFQRNIAFILYGSLYQGMSQEFIYNHLYGDWFGAGTTPDVVLTKVTFDLLVQTPLLTLPMAYLIKGAIFQQSPLEALQKYVGDIQHQSLLQKYYQIWGPVQCLTFGVVPEHYRVTFIAVISFFWLILLSQISSNTNVEELAQAQQVLTEE